MSIELSKIAVLLRNAKNKQSIMLIIFLCRYLPVVKTKNNSGAFIREMLKKSYNSDHFRIGQISVGL